MLAAHTFNVQQARNIPQQWSNLNKQVTDNNKVSQQQQ